jgi:hypothetical protein
MLRGKFKRKRWKLRGVWKLSEILKLASGSGSQEAQESGIKESVQGVERQEV